MKTSPCSCGRAATVAVTLPIRIMGEHRTEMRQCMYCPKCAAAFGEGPDSVAPTFHPQAHEMVAPPAEEAPTLALAPHRRAEFEHERWGWEATTADFERHVAELAQAIEAFQNRDRESLSAYALAGKIRVAAWSIAADTGQMAALENMIANASL